MLTDVVRKSLSRINNRFELVVVTAERTRQILLGARPAVENPTRERVAKVALREIVEGRIKRETSGWSVDRPPMAEIFTPPPAGDDDEDILGLRSRGRDDDESE